MQTIIRIALGFSAMIAFYTACRPHPKSHLSYKSVGFAPFSEKDSHYQLRTRLVSQAAQQIGSRYRGGKQSRSEGFDCSGLIFYAFQKVDIPTARISRQLAKDAKRIPFKDAKPGDLLFFGYKGSIGHVGMVAQNDTSGVSMIHASTSRGVIKENISKQKYWLSRLQFAGDMIATCYGKVIAVPKKTEKSSKKPSKKVEKSEKTEVAVRKPSQAASKTVVRMGQREHQGRVNKQDVPKATNHVMLHRTGFSEHHGRIVY
jgi:NlpC/P60 family